MANASGCDRKASPLSPDTERSGRLSEVKRLDTMPVHEAGGGSSLGGAGSLDGIRRPRPWLTVALLCFLYAASFLDRMILALLVQPVKADLGLSDTQFALIFGTAFALCYALLGLPLAHLADRGHRRKVLLGGIVLWSLATLGAGLSTNFVTLLVTRAGVAFGEAVLMPVAISMIADLFPPARRVLPTSIISMVGAVMGAGSLIVGSGILLLASPLAHAWEIAAWRVTLALVALPGLCGAALFALLVADPVRRAATSDSGSMLALARHLRSEAPLYMALFLGVALMLVQAMGLLAWGATMLAREHRLSMPAAGSVFGAAAVFGAFVGTMSVPSLVGLLGRDQPVRAILRAAFAYAVVTAPLFALGV
jgi:MFS family permease